MVLLYIFVILSLAWFGLVFHMVNTVMNKTLAYTKTLDPQIKEEHKPFERTDRKNWKFWQFVICGWLLIPIRIVIVLSSLVSVVTLLKIAGVIEKNNHKKVYKIKPTVTPFQRMAGFFIHFGFGIYSVETIQKKISDFDKTYKVDEKLIEKNYLKQGPITISNHVSWIDTMILVASKYTPSFLSKKAVASYPLYGPCTTSLQSIYLDRENEQNRGQAQSMINERCDLIKEGKQLPVLLIFPEGTTSNGKYLISFKKGAFSPLAPVNIVCLKYHDRNFHNALDIGQLYTVLFQLCQWKNSVTLYDLGTYYPQGNLEFKGDDNDWKIYADKVKEIMSKCLNVKQSEAGFRDMKEYQEVIKEQSKKLRQSRKSKKKD